MSFILQYIDQCMKNMGYTSYSFESVTIEKSKTSSDIVFDAYNEFYFLNSYFFPVGAESLCFGIYADNTVEEFVHQSAYSGLSELLMTCFFTGRILLTTYSSSRKNAPPKGGGTAAQKANMFLFNFIRVIPQA